MCQFSRNFCNPLNMFVFKRADFNLAVNQMKSFAFSVINTLEPLQFCHSSYHLLHASFLHILPLHDLC